MSEEGDYPAEAEEHRRGSSTDELRTVGFRLREIQRLLAVRVEQENRRLEAEDLEPVEQTRFLQGEE